MTLNTSDRKSVRAAEKASAIIDRQRGEVLTHLMDTGPGREWAWNKLAEAHIFATTFSTDPVQMAYNEGQRNQGLTLLNDIIQWCPDQFILAMREQNERSTSTGRDSERVDPGTEDGSLGELPGDEEPRRDDQGPGAEAA